MPENAKTKAGTVHRALVMDGKIVGANCGSACYAQVVPTAEAITCLACLRAETEVHDDEA